MSRHGSHWQTDPETGAPVCSCTEFHCPWASFGNRCPASICDCFIATHPDDPFGLHPDVFEVAPAGYVSPLPLHRTEANYGVVCGTCDGGGCPDCTVPA